jgi:RND family efflux transporter MFP subunit
MRNLFREGAVAQRDVDLAEAQLHAAEAAAAAAQKALDDATVGAPDDGVIATRFVQAGDRVGDGDPLFRLVNTSELEFSASVPTEALDRIRAGDAVSLSVSGVDGGSVTGRIARVNAAVDAATRQVKVYVNVPNRGRRLAGDMFASGRILLGAVKGAASVPAAGVRQGGGAEYAWVVAAGRLEKRPVTTGVRDETQELVEVKSGLREGERVIVSPIEGLVDGQAVRVAGDSTTAGVPAPARTPSAATPKGR